MHLVALIALAGLGGLIFTWIQPLIQAKLPASLPKGKIATAFVVGAIILLSLWAASLVLGVFGIRHKGA